MTKNVCIVLVSAAALVSTGAANAALVVDDFTQRSEGASYPLVQRTVNVGSPRSGGIDAPLALTATVGGAREVTLEMMSTRRPPADRVEADVYTDPGLLDFASSAGASGRVAVNYGLASQGMDELNLNLSQMTAVVVDFAAFDLASGTPLQVYALLFMGEVTSATPTMTLTSSFVDNTQVLLSILAINPVLRQDVDGIRVVFTGGVGTDFQVDTITVIPEPTALGLLAPAALALGRRRK